MPELASHNNCTGCMACVDSCPHKALEMSIGSDGHYYPRINSDICVNCRLCEKKCPVVSHFDYANNETTSTAYAAWSLIDKIRDRGATTGIFGTLAYKAISEGWKVAGAVMDGKRCRYVMIDSVDRIEELQGSKYTTSDASGIYKEILQSLRDGNKVLFCGLPCHAGALINYIPAKYRNDLLVVDLICGGVPTTKLIDLFDKETGGNCKEIIHFRTKKNGWSATGFKYNLAYRDYEGNVHEIEKGKRNLITDGFACGLTNRISCYDCKFAGLKRKSDLTIGDLWGDTHFPDQHKRGVSLLLAHTEEGKKFLENSEIDITEVDISEAASNNFRLYDGKSLKRYFPERVFMTALLNKLSYTHLLELYGSDLRKKKLSALLISPWRILSFRIERWYHKIRKTKLLKRV